MITLRLSEAALTVGGRHFGADAEFQGVSTDTRSLTPNQLYVALRGQQFDGHAFIADAVARGAAGVLVEQEDPAAERGILVAGSKDALGRLAATWHRRFSVPVVAVTGSNGKTTVKEMLVRIFSRIGPTLGTAGNFNNDIGVPLTLFRQGPEHRYAVIEMGANHPGEIAQLCELATPDVAVITQCAPAHLEGFGSVAGVARAKGEIFVGLRDTGTAIINADDEYAPLWRTLAKDRRVMTFGLQNAADFSAEFAPDPGNFGGHRVSLRGLGAVQEFSLRLPGRHNVCNALAAAACAHAAGAPATSIVAGLAAMESVKGRMQLKAGCNGAHVFDDTYNANPGSLKAALEVLAACPGERWLLLGDMGELGKEAEEFHHKAGIMAREFGVERLYATGELTRHTIAAFGPGGKHFSSTAALAASLGGALNNNVTLLVKGSRSMQMELVVKSLLANGN
jgi:UDP-N-acetylmuramoyl-tripeptide--D-alanyl-D-alanine ligase